MSLKIVKKDYSSLKQHLFLRKTKPNSLSSFSFEVPPIAPVVARQASVSFLISDEMMFFKLGHKTYPHNLYRVLQSLMTINLAGVLQSFIYVCVTRFGAICTISKTWKSRVHVFHVFWIVQMVPNRGTYHIWSSLLVLAKCFAAYKEVLLLYWCYLERCLDNR